MQNVLRCWERQSDGTEYKKTLRQPRLRPVLRWGCLQRSRKSPIWWDGLAGPSPRTPSNRSRLSYPHSKISSDAVGGDREYRTDFARASRPWRTSAVSECFQL